MKKPDVIGKEAVEPIAKKYGLDTAGRAMAERLGHCFYAIAQAQRDDTYEKMLAEVCEEIEKVENPFGGKLTLDPEYGAFEQCRKQILARFKEVKNGS